MKIIQCQRCDVDVIASTNRKFCKACAKASQRESVIASRARTKALNAAIRMSQKQLTSRSRAMTGEGGE